jgi:hypothetical protein
MDAEDARLLSRLEASGAGQQKKKALGDVLDALWGVWVRRHWCTFPSSKELAS